MLLYVVCTAGKFVWNEGGVVPATCYLRLISQCVIFKYQSWIYKILNHLNVVTNINGKSRMNAKEYKTIMYESYYNSVSLKVYKS
jgi:hypothetical protein